MPERPDGKISARKLRALLFVRDPEETGKLVARARAVTKKALDRMEKSLDEEDYLDIEQLVKIAAVGGRINKDFTQIGNALREGLTEDEVLRAYAERLYELEKAIDTEDPNVIEVNGAETPGLPERKLEPQRDAAESPPESPDGFDEGPGSEGDV